MNWLVWRQHRKQFLVLGIILVLYMILAIPTGLHFWEAYQNALSSCGQTDTCGQLRAQLFQLGWENNINPALPAGAFNLSMLLILSMPFLIGMLIGAPLIAREYAGNTNKLVWTQGVSRRRWLTVKLAWILFAVALFAAIFAALTTWWSQTGNALYQGYFGVISFAMQGLAPVGYAVFAVALAATLGAWLKRTLLAVAITLGVVLAVQIMVSTLIRPHYYAPETYTMPFTASTTAGQGPTVAPPPSTNAAAWIIGGGLFSKEGQPLDWANPPQQCIVQNAQTTSGTRQAATSVHSVNGGPFVNLECLVSSGYEWRVQYHSSDRYWGFQLIEFALYLGLAAIPMGAMYWLVLRRDA